MASPDGKRHLVIAPKDHLGKEVDTICGITFISEGDPNEFPSCPSCEMVLLKEIDTVRKEADRLREYHRLLAASRVAFRNPTYDEHDHLNAR